MIIIIINETRFCSFCVDFVDPKAKFNNNNNNNSTHHEKVIII